MLEVRVTISAPELAQAINNLAAALIGVKPQQAAPAPQQASAPVPQPQAAPMQAPVQPQQTQGYAPANPTPAATSAAPAPTGAPVAPMAGPTSAYPSNPQANPTTAPTGAPIAPQTAPVYQNGAPASTYPSNPPAAPVPPQPTGVPVTAAPQYTIDQIMKAGATLMDAGRVDDLMNLLHNFGVSAVTELKPEQTGAFATALRGLGAKI